MAEAQTTETVSSPWTVRVVDAVPVPPIWTGMLLAVLLVGGMLMFEASFGRLDRLTSDTTLRDLVTLLTAFAYVPVAHAYLERWSQSNLADAGRLLGTHEAWSPDVHERRLSGLAGALTFFLVFIVLPGDLVVYWNEQAWYAENVLGSTLVPLLGWLAARFMHGMVAYALELSRMARRMASLDLLDSSSLAPFVHQGLSSALLMVVLIALGLSGIGASLWQGRQAMPSVVFSMGTAFGVAVAALLLPVLGVRRRIREEKQAQLSNLRVKIDRHRRAVLAGSGEAEASVALPGLLALESRLQSVHEWPFDLSNLLRFALYLAVGVGSWLGAALVERLLDRALT